MIYRLINSLLSFCELAIVIEVIMSWFMRGRENQFSMIIHKITQPLLEPGKRLQDRLMPNMMVDFSPVIALLIIYIIRQLVVRILFF